MEECGRLFGIILKGKQGDKEAIEEIIKLFEPLIMGSIRGADERVKAGFNRDYNKSSKEF